jgi:hypothetical protein
MFLANLILFIAFFAPIIALIIALILIGKRERVKLDERLNRNRNNDS